MTNEQKYLLTILSDHLMGRETSRQDDIDWKLLYADSINHQIMSIAFYQCKDYISEDIFDTFQKAYYKTLAAYIQRNHFFDELSKAFRKAGIDFITVKGMNIGKYYPLPEFRTMGDIDFIMSEEDRPKAQEIIIGQGFKHKMKINGGEWEYVKGDTTLEIHSHIVYDAGNLYKEAGIIDYFNNYKPHTVDGEISHEFNFLVALRHIRKHLMNKGLGIRQFYDIAVLCKYDKDIDWDEIEKILDELGLRDFAERVLAFCKYWFSIEPPFEISEPDDSFYNEMIEIIFKNGVFGQENEDNEGTNQINRILRDNADSRGKGKLRIALGYVFPSYSRMKEKYKILERLPFLLPFAWVYRFFDAALGGRASEGAGHIKHSLVSDEKIEKREDLYNKWGI